MTKRVLLTGGTGFIGRHAIPFLLERGFEVHAVSRSGDVQEGVQHHHVNMLDTAAMAALARDIRPTHLLHFAWIATPGVYQESPENHAWRDASLSLFRACKDNGCTRIVAAGSCFEYDWSEGRCEEYTTPLKATTLYGRCKNECREELEKLDIGSAWGRIFFLYGPHEPEKKLIASVILSLLKGQKAECTHGRQIRDFLYVKDVASAFVHLLESDVTGPVNIASGQPVTLGSMVTAIGRMLGKEGDVLLGARPAPPDEPAEISASVERLKASGWTPAYTHEQGLAESIEWWRERL